MSTYSELLDQVSMILAGGVAERIYLGEHSIGVSGDVQQAKEIIERMVNTGLLQDGFTLTFNKSEKEAKMQFLFDEALRKTESLIQGHASDLNSWSMHYIKKKRLKVTKYNASSSYRLLKMR